MNELAAVVAGDHAQDERSEGPESSMPWPIWCFTVFPVQHLGFPGERVV